MILAVQSLFPEGHIFLFDAAGGMEEQFSWEKSSGHPNLLREIARLLHIRDITPKQVTKLLAVQGPGPFTAVRSIAVIARTWQAERPDLEVFAVPSGAFLKAKFPEADELILPAGKTAFFRFDRRSPERFEKHPLPRLPELAGNFGGYFDSTWPPELISRFQEGRSDLATFQELLKQSAKFTMNDFLPVYGAEASVSLRT